MIVLLSPNVTMATTNELPVARDQIMCVDCGINTGVQYMWYNIKTSLVLAGKIRDYKRPFRLSVKKCLATRD